jgi:hypothetical protein
VDSDGRISYRLKRPWPDGRTHLVLEPVAFLRPLVGIIPPPRRHLVRYAGVFGPAAKARGKLRALIPIEVSNDRGSLPGHDADRLRHGRGLHPRSAARLSGVRVQRAGPPGVPDAARRSLAPTEVTYLS